MHLSSRCLPNDRNPRLRMNLNHRARFVRQFTNASLAVPNRLDQIIHATLLEAVFTTIFTLVDRDRPAGKLIAGLAIAGID